MKRTSRKTSQNKQAFSQRTIAVWVGLVMGMALVSGLLLALEGGKPGVAGAATLSAMDSQERWQDNLLNTRVAATPGQWKSITIRHSGQPSGNAAQLAKLHQSRQLNYGSLGFHFVINNGLGATDGLVETGPRWDRQQQGQYGKDTITICLIGDGNEAKPTTEQMRSLVRLVDQLCLNLNIPASAVYAVNPNNGKPTAGKLFPADEFHKRVIAAVSAE